MKAGIVQKIFNDHFESYRSKRLLCKRQRNAAWNIMTCRTPEQGYHINACPADDYRVKVYNSCKHRGCPQCGAADTELWLERRRRQALACRYFHIVFTISHDLHVFWRYSRKRFVNLMMRGAWHTLRELLCDWRWLGGVPGAIGVFQSWDDEMREHCHLHFIVTAGGLNPDDRWVESDKEFLLPTPVLASKFRGKFLAYLRQDLLQSGEGTLRPPVGMRLQQCLNLLNRLGRVRWHANIEPAYEHANGIFKYVGRYIRRGPISEKRIVGYDGESVTIRYAHLDKHRKPWFRITAEQFIQRILNHVPAKGVHVVRSYGLFHPNCIDRLNKARRHLDQGQYKPLVELPTVMDLIGRMFPGIGGHTCPRCGSRLRTVFVYKGGHVRSLDMAA